MVVMSGVNEWWTLGDGWLEGEGLIVVRGR